MQKDQTETSHGSSISQDISFRKLRKSRNFYRTEYIRIDSYIHKQLVEDIEQESRILSHILKKCYIEIFNNNNIIVLRFPIKSIYSEQAVIYQSKFVDFFKKIKGNKVQVIPYVALLKDYKKEKAANDNN